MSIVTLVLGQSGTGKSASMRNLDPAKTLLLNVANKPLPFKANFETVNTDDYATITRMAKTTLKPIIVIDDSQYLMANEFMRRSMERGYDKFTEIAQAYWKLVRDLSELKGDKRVYVLSHVELDANGNEKAKTIGKMLDEKITVEGMYTIVLKTGVKDGKYSFFTQNNGRDTVKSPIGMFDAFEIDNDLALVDKAIVEYYELSAPAITPQLDTPTDSPAMTETVAKAPTPTPAPTQSTPSSVRQPRQANTSTAQASATEPTPVAPVTPKAIAGPTRRKQRVGLDINSSEPTF